METLPKVSIIATFYNSASLGDFVHKTMQSLLLQTYENIEFVFVNDGSQDDTLLQLQEYQKKDDRIFIINKKNEGTAQYAKAAGQEAATGDYIMLFDHDDALSHDAIEKAVEAFIENPLLEMVGFMVKVCFANGKTRALYNLDEIITSEKKFSKKIMSGIDALSKTIGRYDFHFRGVYKKNVFKQQSFRFTEKLLNADEIVERLILEHVQYIGNCNAMYFHYIFPNSSAKSFNLKKTDLVVTDIILRAYFKRIKLYETRKQIFEFVAYKNFISGLKTLSFFRKKISPNDLDFYLQRLRDSHLAINKQEVLKNYSSISKIYNFFLLSLPFKYLFKYYQIKEVLSK